MYYRECVFDISFVLSLVQIGQVSGFLDRCFSNDSVPGTWTYVILPEFGSHTFFRNVGQARRFLFKVAWSLDSLLVIRCGPVRTYVPSYLVVALCRSGTFKASITKGNCAPDTELILQERWANCCTIYFNFILLFLSSPTEGKYSDISKEISVCVHFLFSQKTEGVFSSILA